MSTNVLSFSPEGAETPNLGEFIIHHLQDSHEWNLFGYHVHLPTFEPVYLFGIKFDLSITLHVVTMWFAGLFLVTVLGRLYRKPQLVPRGLAALVESIVLFVRDEIAVPNLGARYGKVFTPFLSTLFLFILTLNLMGLIPIFATATGNISVTASLALITFAMMNVYGIKENGFIGFYKNMVPHGVPFLMIPLLFFIEILGLFTKSFALAMRLFANMIAGHAVIFAFLGLIIVLGTVLVSVFAVPFAVFIHFLELLVAFIQAYIFTMLTSLFVGMAMHPEH